MHRFRDNSIFLETGNDVKVISLLGAPYILFNGGFWKGDPKFIIMLHWHILPIFYRRWVIRLFHFGWDFPTAGEICEVFGENDPQSQNFEKLSLRGHFLASNRVFELLCVEVGSRVWAVRVVRKEKTKKIKGTRPRYFTTTWGHHHWYDPNQTWQSWWTAWRYHPCQVSNQTIHNCDFCKRLNFTILALLGPSPLTRLSPACDFKFSYSIALRQLS